MMLSRVLRATLKPTFNAVRFSSNAAAAAAPTVADVTVYVNFVDTEGQRIRVPGRIGQSVYDVALMHKVDMDGHDTENNPYSFRRTEAWTEDEFGEGPSSAQDHVIIDDSWKAKLPEPMPEEVSVLQDHVYHNDLTANSRLGSQILLSKDIDEIVVHLVSVPPSDIP